MTNYKKHNLIIKKKNKEIEHLQKVNMNFK
jgi:hypothetical protein